MLTGIHPLLSPELLYALSRMGHGDEVVVVDANFPAASCAGDHLLIDLPGATVPEIVAAILTVLPLDTFVDAPLAIMEVVGDPGAVPPVIQEVRDVVAAALSPVPAMEKIERHGFYARARSAFAIVAANSDNRPYGNIVLKKGVVFPEAAKS